MAAFVRERTLVVFVESAAWGTRIRFEQTAMLSTVRAAVTTADPQRIRIKVLPPRGNPSPMPQPAVRRSLSTAARHSLHAAANAVADPELAAALRRLASR
jgi:hypothetical protein